MKTEEIYSALRDRAKEYIAVGCLGTFRPPTDLWPVIVRGEGSRVFDSDGKSYVDFIMGSGPLILGHAHPLLVESVQRQAERGTTYYWISEPLVELAEKVVRAVPCAQSVKFTNSGTEATYLALRMARAFTGREKIAKFEGAYHGVHDYSLMSCTPSTSGRYPGPQPDSGGIPRGVADSVLVLPFNDIEGTSRVLREHANELAAVIVEPLQRVIKPRGSFLQDLLQLTHELGIVLIFDEIVTGFRLDYGGAQEHYGVIPDMAVYGKALTGGLPMAAVAGRAELMETADPARSGTPQYAYFSGTLSGNPLCAAAGVACLKILEKPGILKDLHDRGERFMEQIRDVGRMCSVPLQVEGDGPVLQIFLCDSPIEGYSDTLRHDKARGKKMAARMWEKGIMVNLSKIYLSLVHAEDDYNRFLEVLKEALMSL